MCMISGVNAYLDLNRRVDQNVNYISQETVRFAIQRGAVENQVLDGVTATVIDSHKAVQIKINDALKRIEDQSASQAVKTIIEKINADETRHAELFNEVTQNVSDIGTEKVSITDTLKQLGDTLGEAISTIDAEEVELAMEGENLDGMTQISEVIQEVDGIESTIATAVEEQSASSKEIAHNISQASAGEIANQSSQVNLSAETLARLAEGLEKLVNRFKI